ncbi:glycosyltransferase family 34 protein [Diplodia corticola]|uniref:Glycosyltransferase family 34 protein n=1 Tax=Diplodia corticola TaxID=236234 RepID=A0A1J9QQ75_9PEZI|nr:glycosyltransferase family 34 protein [Diplodia corticola]OJD30178.1 glycosyltransferase family 34 protein [Diplodia corticola]
MAAQGFWDRHVHSSSSTLRNMMNMKYPVLTLLLVWALLAFLIFTTRSTVFLGSPKSTTTTSIWEQNPSLCRNPSHPTLRNESDYNTQLSSQSPVRMGKVTVLYGDVHPTYERALRTHQLHNRIHGLREFVLRTQVVDGVWNKPAYILSVLVDELAKPDPAARLEWLLWVDGDTVVLNPCVPPSRFLPPTNNDFDNPINAIVTRDWNGLNNGIFLLRVSPWSLELFAGIVAYRQLRPGEPLTFLDQSAMEHLLREERFRDNVAYVPQRWFNAYHALQNETLTPASIRRGDFLVHFAGRGRRREEMEFWLGVAERHAPDWELDFWRTGYPEDIGGFWEEWGRGRGRDGGVELDGVV